MTISRKYRPRLVIMVKEPVAGRVKTRLGRDIGMTAAAWWFRHQTRRLIRRLNDPRWEIVLAVSPDKQGLNSRFWPAQHRRVPQGHGDLGHRMARLLANQPYGPVCIIGGDIPAITRAHIDAAFRALGQSDYVFGPATDGGYWLVGAKRTRALPTLMFDGVRWSSEFALADTVATLPGVQISYVATLSDVDEYADLVPNI